MVFVEYEMDDGKQGHIDVKKLLLSLALIVLISVYSSTGYTELWKNLANGIEYRLFPINSGVGNLHIVKIDPTQAKLTLLLASEHDKRLRTAAQWCEEYNLIAAINAGMFQGDYLTNVGYLKNGSYIQNKRWKSQYKSVLAFDPTGSGLPSAIMVDVENHSDLRNIHDYASVIQNLRLMKGRGVNVWSKSDRKWSEAAVGMDKGGHVLFVFSRYPFTMREFNEVIKSLDLGVVSMMHVEGGPLASLSIRAKDVMIDLTGSYESDVHPDDTNNIQWPIPNIIGVRVK